MKKISKIILILILGFILLSSLIIPFATAQQLSPDEQGCIVKQFKENAYAPFRIVQSGDPAIRNSIEDNHQNTNSRWHLDRAEFEEPDSPTVLNFFTDSVDDWKFTVRTEYKTEAIDPRPITVSYQSNNVNFLTETFYRSGFNFCIIYYVQVRDAPHIFTEEEILETADKIQEENFAVVGDTINDLIDEVVSTKNSNNIINAIMVIFIMVFLFTNIMQRRGNKALTKGLKQERQMLAGERAMAKIERTQNKRNNEEMRKDVMEKLDNSINYIEMSIRALILDIKPRKDEQKPEKEDIQKIPDETFNGDYEHDKELMEKISKENEIASKDILSDDEKKEIEEIEKKQDEIIQKDNDAYLHQFEPTDKKDPLKLQETLKNPKSYDLLHHGKKVKIELEKILTKKDSDPEPELKDVAYYEKHYEESLSGHSELIEEFDIQSKAYDKTHNKDSLNRTNALANLSHSNKKFDPKEELE